MIRLNKVNIFFSTLNFVLVFIGYQLATSLLLPVSSNIEGISRTITIPYRAFALFISLIVIFLNFKSKVGKTHLAVKILWIYWIALIIRIFYDVNIRIGVRLVNTQQLWLYIFGIILPTVFSIMKSYKIIDFNKALKWVYLGTAATLFLSLSNNSALLSHSSEIAGRVGGNVALNTIKFGHLGTMGLILSMFLLSRQNVSLIKKIFFAAIFLLSFVIMLKAGSRSPILALAVVLIFWLFARGKNAVSGAFIAVLALVLIALFVDSILNFMGNISPVIESRLRASIYEGDTSERDLLFKEALAYFLEEPFRGKQFAIFTRFGGFYYSHNIVLDSLMALGILGGLAMIYMLWIAVRCSYFMIKTQNNNFWVALVLIQQIVLSMLSGAFYYNQILNVLLVFVVLYTTQPSKIKKGLHCA